MSSWRRRTTANNCRPPLRPRRRSLPGDAWPGVPRLTRLLRLVGDLPADANVLPDRLIYDGPLVDAVKNFQRRHGRDVDGRIGAQTLADLNVPLSRRVEQMQWTLERWRWLPDIDRKAPIVVNIPEFRLRAYDENFNVGLTMNVVVGKAYGHGTPVFSENMQYLIFRPYWDVPYSITRAEIVPHLEKDPDYLAKDRLQVVDSRRNPVEHGAGNQRHDRTTARRKALHPADPRSQELARPGGIPLPEQLRHLYARHPGAGVFRAVAAGFQPRLHPAGKTGRYGGLGVARSSRAGRRRRFTRP